MREMLYILVYAVGLLVVFPVLFALFVKWIFWLAGKLL